MKSRVRALFIALSLLTTTSAWPQTAQEQLRLAQLRERYPNSTIYLGPSALNDIRTVLREPDRRRRIDSQVPPIPLGAKTLHAYVGSIYRASLDPTQGVVLVVVDFANAKAFEKKASDASGSISQLPWDAQEVRAVAVLSDEIIRTRAEFSNAVDLLRDGNETILSSWEKFRMLSDSGFIADESSAQYVRLLVGKAKKSEAELELASKANPTSYKQIKALILNQQVVESATADLAASAKTNCIGFMGRYRPECHALDKASVYLAWESLKASQGFVVLRDDKASAVIREKYSAELENARSGWPAW